VFDWAIHIARKAAEALQAGRSLWVIVAERGKAKAIQKAIGALAKAEEADYVRVDVVGGWYYYLVACERQPHQRAEQVPGEPLDALSRAAAEFLCWLRAIPDERPEGKKRHCPVARSTGWKMPVDERCGKWRRDQFLDARELEPYLRQFRRDGVPTRGVAENFGACAFVAGYGSWRHPIDIERVREALRAVCDDEDEPGAPPWRRRAV
jgi:hypothetical protein